MLGLDVDLEFQFIECLAGGWPDRRDHGARHAAAQLGGQLQPVGHPQQIHDLVAGGEHGHVDLAGGDGPHVRLQRADVERQIPAIDFNAIHFGAARFEPRHQAGVGLTIFLQADSLLGDVDVLVDGREDFAPRVRLGHAIGGLQPQLFEHNHRLGSASDGSNVGDRRQQPLAVDVPLDFGDQMANADAGHEDDDVDLPGHDLVGKVDRIAIFADGDFAHGRADRGDAAEAFDETGHFGGAAALESGHPQSSESVGGIWHETAPGQRDAERGRRARRRAFHFTRRRPDCPGAIAPRNAERALGKA